MTYPATLDVYTTVNDGDTILKGMFNDPNDGIEKLMIEVGVDGTSAESLKYKCDNFFIAATHVFFAQATPPIGWTIDTAHKDNVLACKSDSGNYSAIGANKGTWTQPSHIHTIAAHNHKWLNVGIQSYDSAGTSYVTLNSNLTGDASGLIVIVTQDGTGWRTNNSLYTQSVNINSGETGSNATTNSYRPYATVGIIATYTGA